EPGYGIVLTVSVVVAGLGVPEFVACQQHGRAIRTKQRGEQGTAHAPARLLDGGIVARTLGPPIGTEVFAGPVLPVFSIGLVVPFRIRDEIGQCESIVRGEKVDAGPRTPMAVIKERP